MQRLSLLAATAALAIGLAGAAHADVITLNGTPADTWHYGSGNNYTPANTEVLSSSSAAGDELDLRFHQTFVQAPASTGNTYDFALGTSPISFDWGIDTSGTGSFNGVTALITMWRVGGPSFSYDPFFVGNDNSVASGSAQNSFRLVWGLGAGFDPTVNSTYGVKLDVHGLTGGDKTLTAFAKLGNGAAVPEPATWAFMIVGFGGAGFMLRKTRKLAAA